MRRLTLCAAMLALGGTLLAATPARAQRKPKTQDELKALYVAKQAGPWLANAAWLQDYDAARRTARATGKLMLVYFTRSYAP